MGDKTLKICMRILIVSLFMLLFSTGAFADFGDTLLKVDVNHPDVKFLEEKLVLLGYLDAEKLDNLFDESTKEAVISFQKEYKLEADGIAGSSTKSLITVVAKQYELVSKGFTNIKKDDTGENVSEIQKLLKDYGLLDASITGNFAEKTEAAVVEFQKQFGLNQTGIVDKMTYLKLKSVSAADLVDRASSSRAKIGSRLTEFAKSLQGIRYVWGSSSTKGFDCSGFTQYVLKNFGVNLDHQASQQYNDGIKIAREKLSAGDLVFFRTSRTGVGHVGIYIGDDKFIHASSSKKKVVIDDLSWYSQYSSYIGARRFDLK